MKALTFWKTVVADRSDFLDRVIAVLKDNGIRYCLIGGQAVNAYVEPVVGLDLDIAVALEQLDVATIAMGRQFEIELFEHSVNVSDRGSDLRVQLQTDPRYSEFVARAAPREVLGRTFVVADIADVLQGKVWAASDPTPRQSKRLKDYADIARILEVRPGLADRVPPEISQRLT
ncbi:MAG TPA: hypothetical protein VI759_04580 [Dehalococcoidia bacterium]|nr:hypothetical protein [Dehalococcoidia bacterium]